jgi:Zn-dependent protease with chaperone function
VTTSPDPSTTQTTPGGLVANAGATASNALRWSLTAQALAGGGVLLLLLVAAAWVLCLALGLAGGAWADGPAWLVLRVTLALAAVIASSRILHWLWVPLPAPQGIPLARQDAPALHDLLDNLRAQLRIRQGLAVNVTGEMNASIAPRPRGLTLQIGLPLLLGVTPRQCDAILSHEIGHLVLQRTGPGAWASHLRAWWYRVLDRIDLDTTPMGRAMAWALSAADRRYLADGLRLSRAEEFEADALAAGTVGGKPLAEALAAMALKEHFLAQDFLPKIHAQVYHRQRPSMLPYRHMASAFLVGYDPGKSLAAIAEAATDEDAPTHPSIRARMARLTTEHWPVPGDSTSAAEAYLDSAVPRLAAALDQAWWNEHGHDWQRHHREVQWARRRIAKLAERGRDQHPLRRLELARLVETYCPDWNPLDLYLDLLAEETAYHQAMLALGRLLMEQGSIEGAGYLLAILDQDNEQGLAAAALLLDFATETGQDDITHRAAARATSLRQTARAIEQETERDPEGDGWSSPGLDPIARYKLAKLVASRAGVRRAYLVRRLSARSAGWQSLLLLIRTDSTDPALLVDLAQDARGLLQDRGLLSVLALPTGSTRERAAAAIGRARLHLRRGRSPA